MALEPSSSFVKWVFLDRVLTVHGANPPVNRMRITTGLGLKLM